MTDPLPLVHRGKVRDVYDGGDGTLVMVASDRISAFDVVMAEPIPDKGRILTGLSLFWFETLADLAPNHVVATTHPAAPPEWDGRMMVVRRAEMLPIECIVRGYVAGSAWAEYRERGTIHGMPAPAGLVEADRLPEPMFTPSTKAAVGAHDENVSFDDAAAVVGRDVAERARALSLAVYEAGAARAAARGIIVADTKFELGWIDGELALCDEVLTPDSSRFWPADAWRPGATPPSFDKQPLRDWLSGLGWDRRPPPPTLPPDVVAATRARYVEAFERLTGRAFVRATVRA